MRLTKGLLCAVLICALCLPAIAEDGAGSESAATSAPVTQAPATAEPATAAPEATTAQPTASSTDEVTQSPTQAPSDTDATDPSTAPTQEATPAPTVQPEEFPTSEPTVEPSTNPTDAPSIEPTQEPEEEPTPDPSATPRPEPGTDSGLISITPEGNAQNVNDVWSISLSTPDSALSFVWTCEESATLYLIYTTDAAGNTRFISETQSECIELSAADYASGRSSIHVGAILADDSIIWGSASFEMASGFPGGMPGGFGGFGGHGGGAGSMGGAMMEAEMGFRVTPGEALTSTHASGTKDTTAYTYSEVSGGEEAITSLSLSSTQEIITLDDGANAFYADNTDGTLTLTPETGGTQWQLSALAMNTLSNSGVDTVVFQIGGTTYTLSTHMEFSGSVYAALRAQGYVDKDCRLCISNQGVIVCVGENSYSINEENELIPLGANAQ